MGTIVEVKNSDNGELMEHELVGGYEAPRAKTASAASPIGQALIGRKAGEIVVVHLPKGGRQRLEIVGVRPVGRTFSTQDERGPRCSRT